MPAKPLDADAPEPVSSEESATSGVALRERSIAAIRRLYAKGDVDGAMALATKHAHEAEQLSPPARDWTDASVSIQIGPEVEIDIDVSLTGLTSHVESGAIDVSLSGLESHRHGADAPDASVHVWVEAEAVDVSLTGLESFDHPADRSLPGLSGIIDDIESLEPTLGFGKRTSRRELLAQQKLFAQDLDAGVMPHITMPPQAESVPEVLTSEVPFPSAPGMRPPPSLSEGERRSIPRVLKSPSEIATLPLGPRGGFILAQMDGMQTIEEIFDVCAMPMAEAIEIIRLLESLGVIRLE